MLKLGLICSGGLLLLGAGLLALLASLDILRPAAMEHAVQALIYGCLAVFGVFWTIHTVRNAGGKPPS